MGHNPNSLANLKKFTSGDTDWRTPEQKKEWSRAGGEAFKEKNRRKKRLTEAAKWLLAAKDIVSDDDIKAKLRELGVEDDGTNAEVIALVALRKAAKGDVEAMKFVRDTAGEAPKNQVELSGDLDKPVATLDLRNLSNDELARLAEAKAEDTESGADEA